MRTGTTAEIEITFIRHGKTISNESGRYLGKTDEPLSEAGRCDLLQKYRNRNIQKPDILFSSPMKRCLETAMLLYDQDPIVIPEWTEMDFGTFEGKNYQELNGNADYQAWIDSNGTLPFPKGESREHFIDRCMVGFERMLNETASGIWNEHRTGQIKLVNDSVQCQKKCHVTAVVHGGTIMAVASTLEKGDYFDYQVRNGEEYKISVFLCYRKVPCTFL